ncbi:GNAT family N-acetyltransferase [Kibdelosporangium phytohabitans]|uniref:GCN5 family acetyltransferase n=1 Tax=Kibdelosporangium phytohabitans TaxID=860235 RepID=A0A0N9HKP9_9PSEU|nr:GNAT family N-acetyltransferase [Kibdelosporangium phytohabitans]ALG06645.1 GCN5 family acetyltransferase [Kibdelosporangium phytohabitans]MBE1467856.1 ribosomal protein S18 acetylase RimI-like enzyme [Kibdelosporangium phytohabitans]
MDTVTRLEHDCAQAWPALVDEPLGQWRMRAAGGFTGRANSTLTCGDPGVDVRMALRRAAGFAERNGIRPTLHVVIGTALDSAITRLGWTVNLDHPGGAESLVMTGPLAPGEHEGAHVDDTPSTPWWELTAGSGRPTPAQRHVLSSAAGVGYGVLERHGQVVAAVRGAIVGDLLHVARLAVRPEYRRQGLAVGLLKTLYSWAHAKGATRQALQVAEHNVAAIRLYEGVGCTEHHRYRYWIPC